MGNIDIIYLEFYLTTSLIKDLRYCLHEGWSKKDGMGITLIWEFEILWRGKGTCGEHSPQTDFSFPLNLRIMTVTFILNISDYHLIF